MNKRFSLTVVIYAAVIFGLVKLVEFVAGMPFMDIPPQGPRAGAIVAIVGGLAISVFILEVYDRVQGLRDDFIDFILRKD